MTSKFISEQSVGDTKLQYELAEESLAENQIAVAQSGKDPMREMERRVLFSVVDRLWREHLYGMDYLKGGTGSRAMGQRDPLVEYKTEGYLMFKFITERVKGETVRNAFGYAKAFMEALEQAQLVEGDETESAVVNENAALESRDKVGHSRKGSKPKERWAGTKSINANHSVMGDTGCATMSEQVTYSGDDPLEPAVTGNRAQRRVSRKRR